MRLQKFLGMIIIVTMISLIYICLQVKIFDLAYQGKYKEGQIRQLTDDNGIVICRILALKSANNLGVQLLKDNSDMRFLDKTHIVKLATPEVLEKKTNLVAKIEKAPNFFINLFSLKSQAEAKPME